MIKKERVVLYAINDKLNSNIKLIETFDSYFIWDYFTKDPFNYYLPKSKNVINISGISWLFFIHTIGHDKKIIKKYIKRCRPYSQWKWWTSEKCGDRFRNWFITHFDYTPKLGYHQAAVSLMEWYNARSKVMRYLSDPDYKLVLYTDSKFVSASD